MFNELSVTTPDVDHVEDRAVISVSHLFKSAASRRVETSCGKESTLPSPTISYPQLECKGEDVSQHRDLRQAGDEWARRTRSREFEFSCDHNPKHRKLSNSQSDQAKFVSQSLYTSVETQANAPAPFALGIEVQYNMLWKTYKTELDADEGDMCGLKRSPANRYSDIGTLLTLLGSHKEVNSIGNAHSTGDPDDLLQVLFRFTHMT